MTIAGCVYCQRLPESNYQQPRAVVTEVLSDAARSVIRLDVDWGSWQPRREALELAPASLYAAQHPHAEVQQLHQLRYARETPSRLKRSASRTASLLRANSLCLACGGFPMRRPSSWRPSNGARHWQRDTITACSAGKTSTILRLTRQ